MNIMERAGSPANSERALPVERRVRGSPGDPQDVPGVVGIGSLSGYQRVIAQTPATYRMTDSNRENNLQFTCLR